MAVHDQFSKYDSVIKIGLQSNLHKYTKNITTTKPKVRDQIVMSYPDIDFFKTGNKKRAVLTMFSTLLTCVFR